MSAHNRFFFKLSYIFLLNILTNGSKKLWSIPCYRNQKGAQIVNIRSIIIFDLHVMLDVLFVKRFW